jgi:hypothetical protein
MNDEGARREKVASVIIPLALRRAQAVTQFILLLFFQ